MTVRSAPVSMSSSNTRQLPSPVRISARMTGRTMPSSHGSHSPLNRIDSGHLRHRDVARKPSFVVRMGGGSLGDRVAGGIGNKQFLPGNTNAFSSVSGVDVRNVILQPGAVSIELLSLLSPLDLFVGIHNLLHLDDGLFVHGRVPNWSTHYSIPPLGPVRRQAGPGAPHHPGPATGSSLPPLSRAHPHRFAAGQAASGQSGFQRVATDVQSSRGVCTRPFSFRKPAPLTVRTVPSSNTSVAGYPEPRLRW